MDKTKTLSIALVAMILVSIGGVSGAGFFYVQLQTNYNSLLVDYEALSEQYVILTGDHATLDLDYNNLYSNYVALQNAYSTLEAKYSVLCDYISNQILPLQLSSWAEAVRRVYQPSYLDGYSGKEYWMQFAAFCRDMVLHASRQYDAFGTCSDAYDFLSYGGDTMQLAYASMYVMSYDDGQSFDKFPILWGWTIWPELTGINNIVQDCIDNIDYEYDSDITTYQDYSAWDYIKHPVETAFRTMGDCEDQAILCASYLEESMFSNGTGSYPFECAIAIHHDPTHLGGFYHGSLLVHISDTTTYNLLYPLHPLWNLGSADPYSGYTWCWLDPTWDTPFGVIPAWLSGYTPDWDVCTIAICDIDGSIS